MKVVAKWVWRIVKRLVIGTLALLVLLAIATWIFVSVAPQFGAKPEGKRLELVKASPQYNAEEEQFVNPVYTALEMGFGKIVSVVYSRLFEDNNRKPDWDVPMFTRSADEFDALPATETVITWFGHSAFFVEMDGKKILLDPMLGHASAPVSFAANRFYDDVPLSAEDLPAVDAVFISHDHYDHLDYGTILTLKEKTGHFYIPLGVGAHFERWGIDSTQFTEFDWWDTATLDGLGITFTPSRHFSGRAFTDRNATLWGSWAIRGQQHNLYFGGDSGYGDHFKAIGEKLGPFDLTMVECGQYNDNWPMVHMVPEETVQAHLDLKGKVMMPIHWGAFNLALHSWTDPVERSTAEAERKGVTITTPKIGQRMVLGSTVFTERWWEKPEDAVSVE